MARSKWSPVVKLALLGGYTFKVQLKNGDSYFVDMEPHFRKGSLDQELKNNPEIFNGLKIDKFGGLTWPNGSDMCADWIIANGERIENYE